MWNITHNKINWMFFKYLIIAICCCDYIIRSFCVPSSGVLQSTRFIWWPPQLYLLKLYVDWRLCATWTNGLVLILIAIKKIITISRQGRCFYNVHVLLRSTYASACCQRLENEGIAYLEYFMEFVYTSGGELLWVQRKMHASSIEIPISEIRCFWFTLRSNSQSHRKCIFFSCGHQKGSRRFLAILQSF